MWLLFLLVFNSATTLASDDYSEREATSDRLQVLGVAAWPSLLLAQSSDPESADRSWPLLSRFRTEQRLLQAVATLDSPWPITVEQSWEVVYDYDKWNALQITVYRRSRQEWAKQGNWFSTIEDVQYFLERARRQHGLAETGWPFR